LPLDTLYINSIIESETKDKILRAIHTLEKEFGIPTWKKKDPLDELIVTILSQNTNDRNRDKGYQRLRASFPSWQDVLKADVALIEEAIRPAGLAVQKSRRMQGVLRWINNTFGGLTLQPLKSMKDDEVIELLTTQKGIGVKTAAVVLAFALDRDICPVDTHVHRIAHRLGWVSPKTTAEKVFYLIRPFIPNGKAPTFHLNLLEFGKTRCTARNPHCNNCPLQQDCIWEGSVRFRADV